MKLTTCPEYLKAIANGPLTQPTGYTCQSTCIAAAIGGDVPIMAIRDALSQIGEPGSPDVMGQYLTRFFGDRSTPNTLPQRQAGSCGCCHPAPARPAWGGWRQPGNPERPPKQTEIKLGIDFWHAVEFSRIGTGKCAAVRRLFANTSSSASTSRCRSSPRAITRSSMRAAGNRCMQTSG